MRIRTTSFTICFCLLATILICQTGSVMVKSAETSLWGYVDLDGKELIKPVYRSAASFSSNGLARVRIVDDHTFIKTNGKKIKTSPFDACKNTYSDGLVAVRNSKKKWGYMNSEGEIVIPFQFSEITQFNSGHATVKKNGTYFIIDTKGKAVMFEGKVKEIKKITEGLAPFQSKNKLYGFLDVQAEIAIPARFKAVGYFSDGLAWARDDKGWAGYIDKSGEWIISPSYDDTGNFDSLSGMARVKRKGKWMYIDKNGAEDLAQNGTKKYGHFRSGLAIGKVDGKAGYFDKNMEWAIKPHFDAAKDFHGDYASAKLNGLWGVIDKTGDWVIKPKYAGIKDPVVFDK